MNRFSSIVLGSIAVVGCSNSDRTAPSAPPGTGGSGPVEASTPRDAGHGLRTFTPPADPGAGGILFAASGEVLALTGYAFPPAPGDVAFVDGWEVKFAHLLVTFDKFQIAENPDFVPGDQSKTGAVVAEVDGPWAVDLSRRDPDNLPGKGGSGEQAVPIAAITDQNKNGGEAFATDGTRYAFGFDVVKAREGAYDVNLGDAAVDYQKMITDGCAVLYIGTATFKGDKSDPNCYPDDRKGWPDVVSFHLCFKTPTSYRNCQNPDNDPAAPLSGEEHERGIPLKTNTSTIAQVTMHTDHPFWDSVIHDSPAHFDQFAARVVGSEAGVSEATLEMTRGVDYTDYTDALGKSLNWRYCVEPPTDAHAKFVGAMRFDPQSVPHAVGNDPSTGLRDYYDFATYDQSTQGHLNSDGLCFVKRSYPSPP